MGFQTGLSLLALGLLLTFFLTGCSGARPTESSVVLPTMSASAQIPLPTNTPFSDVEISNLLSRYEWTIKEQLSTSTITLPKTLQHHPGDFPYTIYWAYNNEFNKAIGLDLVPYLGQTVKAYLYVLNEPLPKEFLPYEEARAVVITIHDEIIGAWIEKTAGFACSLDRKQFEQIIGQSWSEWLVSSGVVNASNQLDIDLSANTPEEIIEIYYTALNEHNYQMLNAVRSRRSITDDLFVNKNNLALFNHQEDATITMWINNIESAQLLSIESINNSKNCLPVYTASVDFRFVDPKLPTIPEGENVRFMVLHEEIKGLGWRVEEVNTSPGVSERLCAP